MVDELIRKYADEIERIIRDDTAGDYTWNGLLFSFLREVDEARTLVQPEVSNNYFTNVLGGPSDEETVAKIREYMKLDAPVEDEHRRYDIQTHNEEMGYTLFAYNLTYDDAQQISSSFRDDAIWRIVDHGASTEEEEPEKEPELLYDVIVGRNELYAHKVSYEDAQMYLREAPKWQVPRMVVNQESLNDVSYYDGKSNPEDDSAVDDDENKYYDVQIRRAGGWQDLVRKVTWSEAVSWSENQTLSTNVIDHDPNRVTLY